MYKKILSLIIIVSACWFIFSFSQAKAASLLPTPRSTTPNCSDKVDCGDYTLNDFAQLGVNITEIILGVVGSLALLMFIYGGLSFLISAGNAEAITKARKILVAAAIGLAIVFASYLIIQFVLQGLGYKNISAWNIIKP